MIVDGLPFAFPELKKMRNSNWIRRLGGLVVLSGFVGMISGQDPQNDDKIKKAKEAIEKEREEKKKEIQDKIDSADKMLATTVLTPTEKPQVNDYNMGAGMMMGGGGGGFGFGGFGGLGGFGMGMGGIGNGSFGGYLNGLSNLTQANSEAFFTQQQALLGQQQVNRAKIQNKMAAYNENMYELAKTPEVYEMRRVQKESLREQNRLERLNKSTSIQDGEEYLIDNGFALNKLLDQVKTLQSRFGVSGPNIPLSPEITKHLNFTTPNAVGGAGPLRNPRKLEWPIPLRTREFAPYRATIEKMAPEAVSQAASGNIDGDTYNAFMTSIQKFEDALKEQVEDMRPTDYVLSKRYLSDLEDAAKAISEPSNSVLFLNPANNPNVNSVGGLIAQMTTTGMKFGPANSADVSAYRSFYQLFRSYEDNLSRSVGAR